MNHLKELIREVPDFPRPGILFYDLTTLLKNPNGFHGLVDELCGHYAGKKVDAVVGIEAATVALIRKLGGEVAGASFAVELTFLNGRTKLPGIDVFSMIQYDK